MPVAGRKANTGQPVRHRIKPVHDWIEVDGVPYEDGPGLAGKWPAAVLRWWDVIRRMPHCVLWEEADWRFAMDTAYVYKRMIGGSLQAATELRNREKQLGTTLDYRRDLRIRYVEPQIEAPAGISAIDKYRERLK